MLQYNALSEQFTMCVCSTFTSKFLTGNYETKRVPDEICCRGRRWGGDGGEVTKGINYGAIYNSQHFVFDTVKIANAKSTRIFCFSIRMRDCFTV